MQAAARIQTVIDLLQAMEGSSAPVDRFLRAEFRTRRYAGSKDRAAITGRVFAILHQRAHFSWRMGAETPRALVIASLLAEGCSPEDVSALFNGTPYGPAVLTAEEERQIAAVPGVCPAAVAGEYPLWLEGELRRVFGDDLSAAMAGLQGRAGIDLRVNRLKATRADVVARLTAEGFQASATAFSPDGLRLEAGAGAAHLSASPCYTEGLIEFQDEAAQIASLLCGVRPGMRVLDLAAGAGGKALALAALMGNDGEIVAHDIAVARLERLAPRAERAGAGMIRPDAGAPRGVFAVVLVDAPCSGTGTWRRQPELRWRLTAQRLAELTHIQDGLLDRAAGFVAPGGRLVYATCSLLATEDEDRVEGFLARHPGWTVVPAAAVWAEQNLPPVPGIGQYFRAAPHITGTDGFFTALLQAPR